MTLTGPAGIPIAGSRRRNTGSRAVGKPPGMTPVPPCEPLRRGRRPLAALCVLMLAGAAPDALAGPRGPITPAGDQVRVGRFPQALALAPDGAHVAVANTGTERTISWIDAGTLVTQATPPVLDTTEPERGLESVNALFAGIVAAPDGRRVWAGGGFAGTLTAYDVTPAGLVQDPAATIQTPATQLGRLAVSPDGATIYATDPSPATDAVLAIDPATGQVTTRRLPGQRPFALAAGAGRVWVAGMQTGEVLAFDAGLLPVASTRVAGRPMALALAGRDLLVADADADALVVLDRDTLRRRQRLPLRVLEGGLGASPNDVAVAGRVAAVSLGGANAVAILGRRAGRWALRGLLPTGRTPEAVALAPDGRTVWVANARGDGAATPLPGAPNLGPSPVTGQYGTVSRIPVGRDLRAATAQVRRNNAVAGAGTPDRPPIEHVVFVLRENKTFDSLLGDTPGGNPAFVAFPRPNTPSLHALADRYAVLTRMYANAEASDQGHQWATGGYVTDFVQRFTAVFPRDNACQTSVWGCGNDPITYPQSGYLFDALEDAGLSWRVYGEWLPVLARGGAEQPQYADNRVPGYPGYDLSIPDTERERIWERDFRERGLPAFSFVYLPADHGLSVEDESNPTLQQQVADNDLATGRLVEAISKSPYWERTAIFITEDDPQGYFDHVDGQRTIGLVVSPWAQGRTIDTETDTVGMVRTMEWLLGLDPISGFDAAAPPLAEAFTSRADLRPFEAPPKGLGVPPSPLAARRARAIVESLPEQTGPDQIPPAVQLEFSSLATRGLTAEQLAGRLGVALDRYLEEEPEDE